MISKGSELFAKSIMSKVQENVLSGKFSTETCKHLILAVGNVATDSLTANEVFHAIEELYGKINPEQFGEDMKVIDSSIMKCLIRMAQRAPIILGRTLDFMRDVGCYEGIQILSRKYIIPEEMVR